ncbi:putative dsRNA-binding protein [Rhodococcus koreensis]
MTFTGFDSIARRLLREFFDTVLAESLDISDAVSALSRMIPNDQQRWTFVKDGPDHAATFTATVTAPGGRTVTAAAHSKKAARSAAATEFLRTYGTIKVAATKPFTLPKAMPLPSAARARIDTATRGLVVPAAWRPVLTQAFIHNSYAYENTPLIDRAGQRDNRILAFVGSTVLEYEYTLSTAGHHLEDPQQSYTHLTQTNENLAEAANTLELDRALLLGHGQMLHGVGTEMAASLLQALAAAVYLSHGAPRTLWNTLPAHWDAVRPVLAPDNPRGHDPMTGLQQRLNGTSLQWQYDLASVRGPHHDRVFEVDLRVTSPVLATSVIVRSAPASNQKAARADAARTFAAALDWLAAPTGTAPQRIADCVSFIRAHLDAEEETAQDQHPHGASESESAVEHTEPERSEPERSEPEHAKPQHPEPARPSTRRDVADTTASPAAPPVGETTALLGVADFGVDTTSDQVGYLASCYHHLSPSTVRNAGTAAAVVRVVAELARDTAARVDTLVNRYGVFFDDPEIAARAIRAEDHRLANYLRETTDRPARRLHAVTEAARTTLPLAFAFATAENEVLTTVDDRLDTLIDHSRDLLHGADRYGDDPELASEIDQAQAVYQQVRQFRTGGPERWQQASLISRTQLASVHARRFDTVLANQVPRRPDPTAKRARLTFEVLPGGTSRDFVTERQRAHERQHPRTLPTLDPRRTDILDELAGHYGPARCTFYRGFATQGQLYEIGENITEDYLILVIDRGRGEDAIAISPAAGRHATYLLRHDVTERPWNEVFAHPKLDAKDLGAKRLVFRDRFPLDQYLSMREKARALLDCRPQLFHGRLVYQPERFTYSVDR